MKVLSYILLYLFIILPAPAFSNSQGVKEDNLSFEFCGDSIKLNIPSSFNVSFPKTLSDTAVKKFYTEINSQNDAVVINKLLSFKKVNNLNDWLYYQLIRKTAQQLSPKEDNYYRYTLYKWYLLSRSGYDVTLRMAGDKLLFYVQSDENIYNIPYYVNNQKQYICLNYHDYGTINFEEIKFNDINLAVSIPTKVFSYKITQLPEFNPQDYIEKDLQFTYRHNNYQFKVKLNPQIKSMFTNYPVMDYASYFNIPLSRETYSSLIPLLKKELKNKPVIKGIDFLMRFTRNAFVFEADSLIFGQEKRFSPEQTLLYEQSDCEDRSALFFYLVKEIYDLPMIVLSFKTHITIAVHFDKFAGKPILYNGTNYYVCEPTPQRLDMKIGQLNPDLKKEFYEVVYEYKPELKHYTNADFSERFPPK